jgi:signal peptidase I
MRELAESLFVAIVLALFVRTFLVQAFAIPSISMEHNLLVGDHILVNKFIYGELASWWGEALLPMRRVRRGDIVVFRYPRDPSRDFIKRCVGLPGDTVELRDKVLYVNRQPVRDETYAEHSDTSVRPQPGGRDNFGPLTVPWGQYFCLGDNRDASNDSRFWGPVPTSHLRGRALLVYWSVAGAEGSASDDRGWWTAPMRILRSTRWERSLRLIR